MDMKIKGKFKSSYDCKDLRTIYDSPSRFKEGDIKDQQGQAMCPRKHSRRKQVPWLQYFPPKAGSH